MYFFNKVFTDVFLVASMGERMLLVSSTYPVQTGLARQSLRNINQGINKKSSASI